MRRRCKIIAICTLWRCIYHWGGVCRDCLGVECVFDFVLYPCLYRGRFGGDVKWKGGSGSIVRVEKKGVVGILLGNGCIREEEDGTSWSEIEARSAEYQKF